MRTENLNPHAMVMNPPRVARDLMIPVRRTGRAKGAERKIQSCSKASVAKDIGDFHSSAAHLGGSFPTRPLWS